MSLLKLPTVTYTPETAASPAQAYSRVCAPSFAKGGGTFGLGSSSPTSPSSSGGMPSAAPGCYLVPIYGVSGPRQQGNVTVTGQQTYGVIGYQQVCRS